MQPSEEQLLKISQVYITEIQQNAKAFAESEASKVLTRLLNILFSIRSWAENGITLQ